MKTVEVYWQLESKIQHIEDKLEKTVVGIERNHLVGWLARLDQELAYLRDAK